MFFAPDFLARIIAAEHFSAPETARVAARVGFAAMRSHLPAFVFAPDAPRRAAALSARRECPTPSSICREPTEEKPLCLFVVATSR